MSREMSSDASNETSSEWPPMALSSKPWTKCVLSDMGTLKIQATTDLETKSKKREHFKMTSSAYTLYRVKRFHR
jgi:hypothetical protein